jgi:hypothetical protein
MCKSVEYLECDFLVLAHFIIILILLLSFEYLVLLYDYEIVDQVEEANDPERSDETQDDNDFMSRVSI